MVLPCLEVVVVVLFLSLPWYEVVSMRCGSREGDLGESLMQSGARRVADSVRREVNQSGKLKCCRPSEVKGVGQLARLCTIFTQTWLSDHLWLVFADVILYAVL